MDLKKRIERLERLTLSENQEQKVINYINALIDYIQDETEENYKRLKDTAKPFNFGKKLE